MSVGIIGINSIKEVAICISLTTPGSVGPRQTEFAVIQLALRETAFSGTDTVSGSWRGWS